MTGRQLWEAALEGDSARVSTLLSTQGAQSFINYQVAHAHGCTPLHLAAGLGHAAVTKQLLAARCNVDVQDTNGFTTPLHVAAGSGHEAITKQLIAARCNVDLQDVSGNAPLHIAAGSGHESVTMQLLKARSNVDRQDKNGFTPLHVAAEAGHAAVAKQLLAARCNVDLRANGFTALQFAEGLGHAEIASLIRNKKQETPLLGRRVVINGLVAKPELNGRTGTAWSFDDDKGRYSVELDDTSSSLMIKPCNLQPTVCVVWLYVACCFHILQTLPRLS